MLVCKFKYLILKHATKEKFKRKSFLKEQTPKVEYMFIFRHNATSLDCDVRPKLSKSVSTVSLKGMFDYANGNISYLHNLKNTCFGKKA